MQRRRSTLLFLASVLIMACNFPLLTGTGETPTATATTAPSATAAASETAIATSSPLPGSPAPANTAAVPAASTNGQPVNCRSGPGLNYDVVLIMAIGQSAEIIGKSADGVWLQLRNSGAPGGSCWVSTTVVTTTGNLSGVQIVAAPPAPPTSAVANVVVTNVSVSVDPTTIGVPGCIGPIQPSTASAYIEVNGPISLHWHFETQQNGALSTHTVNFNKAGAKDVSQDFTPPLNAGTWRVELFIDGMNLKGMDAVATYKIHC